MTETVKPFTCFTCGGEQKIFSAKGKLYFQCLKCKQIKYWKKDDYLVQEQKI